MVELREANRGDLDAVLAVHRDAIHSITTDRYTEQEREAWAAAQDDPDQYPIGQESQYLAVAETADDRIVGFVGLDRNDGVLETLYVDPTEQGAGIGSRLLTHAENTLETHGHDVCLIAASLNSVPFYRRHGYRVDDETFLLEMGDRELEFVRMEKPLD
jgi:putative acetyltransferase